MAFSESARVNNAQSKTANQASVTIGGNDLVLVRPDDLLILMVACDNNATVDGDEGAVATASDNGGHVWVKAAEFCNSRGAAQGGATMSVWYTEWATASVGATLSVSAVLSNSASRDATCTTLHRVKRATGNTIAVEATNTLANVGADPSTVDAVTGNIECFRLRAIAGETNSTTAITATTNWTGENGLQTTGGGAASNMALRYENRISTGTSFPSDPTWVGVDCASVYVAFKEVSKTLVADSGSFSFTGTAASLERGFEVAADAGAFSFTGSAATLSKGITIHVDAGAFSFTGTDATLRKTWLLSAEAGSYSFSGTAASLEHGYAVTAEAGSYTFTGSDATLTATSVAAPAAAEPFRGTGGWGAGLGWPLSRKKRSRQEDEEEERRERAEAALDRVLDDVLVIQPAIRARDEREAVEADLLYSTFDEWDRLAA